MTIQLNGETHPIDPSTSVAQLLEQLKLSDQRLAVELNEQILPRSQHSDHILQDGDRVEIVRAIGGG